MDLVAGAARDAYLRAGKDAEGRAAPWYDQPAGWSKSSTIDSINAGMGPLRRGLVHSAPGGLMGAEGRTTLAAPKQPDFKSLEAEMKKRNFIKQ